MQTFTYIIAVSEFKIYQEALIFLFRFKSLFN